MADGLLVLIGIMVRQRIGRQSMKAGQPTEQQIGRHITLTIEFGAVTGRYNDGLFHALQLADGLQRRIQLLGGKSNSLAQIDWRRFVIDTQG